MLKDIDQEMLRLLRDAVVLLLKNNAAPGAYALLCKIEELSGNERPL